MIAECQKDDEVIDESIDFYTGTIGMTTNDTVVSLVVIPMVPV